MSEVFGWSQRTPWGVLGISATADRVVGVRLGSRSKARPLPLSAPAEVRRIKEAFQRYLEGDVRSLEGIHVDLASVQSPFRHRVLETLRLRVGPGRTISYGELAEAAGAPGAARAVGTAMAQNPVPIIVPCHRVLAANGKIGGYGGGLEMKRGLLELEGALVPPAGV